MGESADARSVQPQVGVVALVAGSVALGMILGVTVISPQVRARCYRRYGRLCAQWFANDPVGENGCLERAADVCSW